VIQPRKRARQIAAGRATILLLPKAPSYTEGSHHKILYPSRDDFGARKNEEMCRIVVTGIEETTLDEVSGVQSLMAGFRDLEDLYDFWREAHHDGPISKPAVWIVSFELDRSHVVHLLAASRGDEHGYTENPHNAMDNEPEAVPESVQAEYAKEACHKDSHRKALSWEARRAVYRELMEKTRADALAMGVDVTGDLRVIGQRLEAMDRKLNRAA
jgi:hypothetical protein